MRAEELRLAYPTYAYGRGTVGLCHSWRLHDALSLRMDHSTVDDSLSNRGLQANLPLPPTHNLPIHPIHPILH